MHRCVGVSCWLVAKFVGWVFLDQRDLFAENEVILSKNRKINKRIYSYS